MNEKIKLSLSLSAGLLEWKIDGHKLSLTDQSDPALLNNILRTVVPDAIFGFVLFGDIGILVRQLLTYFKTK